MMGLRERGQGLVASLTDELPGVTLAGYHGEASLRFPNHYPP